MCNLTGKKRLQKRSSGHKLSEFLSSIKRSKTDIFDQPRSGDNSSITQPPPSHLSFKISSSLCCLCRAILSRQERGKNMSKILNALLVRNPKNPKLKTLASYAIAQIPILKNQHNVRRSHAKSDVVQLLNLGHQDRAQLRVEVVIRENNMLDVLDMVEKYCHILIGGFLLMENNRECPEELNEAISSLIFAASRCREIPVLQEMRIIFNSMYGKEFVARAIDLGNNCRVNLEMIQKLSKRPASLETRKRLLKQIAPKGFNLHLDDNDVLQEKHDIKKKEEQLYKANEAAELNDVEAAGEYAYKKGGLERSFSSSSSNTEAEDLYDVNWTGHLDQTTSPCEEIDIDQSDEESFSDNKEYEPHCESPKMKPRNPEDDLATYSAEGRYTRCLEGEKRVYKRVIAFKYE